MSAYLNVDGEPVERRRSDPADAGADGEPATPACGQVRVTIASGTRRTDLVLPVVVPLVELTPRIVELAADEAERARPRRWVLCEIGSAPLDVDATLHANRIRDGAVLILAPESDELGPARIDDVRDATEDVVDAGRPPWRRAVQVRGLLLVLTATSAGLGGVTIAGLLPAARAFAAGVVLAPTLLASAVWAARQPVPVIPHLLGGLGCMWAGLLAWLAPWWSTWGPTVTGWTMPLRIAVTTTAVCALAEVARRMLPPTPASPTGTVVVLAAGLGLAGTTAAGTPIEAGVGLCGVAAVLAVGVLPRLAVATGGLGDLDQRVRADGAGLRDEVQERVDAADAVLTGGLLGVATVATGASIHLAAQSDTWPRCLGCAIALALVARSRLYSGHVHVVVLRGAGSLGVLAAAVRLYLDASRPVGSAVVLAAGLAVLVGATGLSVKAYSEVAAARLSRTATAVEWCLVAALVPLLAATIGLFDRVSELTP